MPADSALALTLNAEAMRPLIHQIVTATLAHLDAARAALPDQLAYREPEAARLLSLEPHQLRDARLRGEITASVGPKRTILYQRADLLQYLASRPWRGKD